MMFKSVENEVELAQYNGVWTTVWHESGYGIEFGEYVLDRNIIFTEQREVVGSAEIKRYHPDNRSNINSYASFDTHPWVIKAKDRVGECDKVALLKSFRGKGKHTHALLTSICVSAEKHNLLCMVSLLEPLFMKALIKVYKVPMEVVGQPFFYKGDYVIPTVMDVGYINAHREQFAWYLGKTID